jgi:GNAT superfamily N-acetyltransferase
VAAQVQIAPIAPAEYEDLLPLIAAYQRFYGVEKIDEERNRSCSLAARESVLMNDLFILPDARGRGIGRALIEATADVARDRGAGYVEWETEPGNRAAQRLYDSTGAKRSKWISYELWL